MDTEVANNYLTAFITLTNKKLTEVEKTSPAFRKTFEKRRDQLLETGAGDLRRCKSIPEARDKMEHMYAQLSPYWT